MIHIFYFRELFYRVPPRQDFVDKITFIAGDAEGCREGVNVSGHTRLMVRLHGEAGVDPSAQGAALVGVVDLLR